MVMWWWSRMIILESNRRMLTCIELYYITIWLLNRNHSFKPPPQICKCIFICQACLYLSCRISNPLFKLSPICISLYNTHHVHTDRCMSFTIFDKRQTGDIPHICHFFYIGRIFESQYFTPKKYEKHPKITTNSPCGACDKYEVWVWRLLGYHVIILSILLLKICRCHLYLLVMNLLKNIWWNRMKNLWERNNHVCGSCKHMPGSKLVVNWGLSLEKVSHTINPYYENILFFHHPFFRNHWQQ